MFPSCFYVYVMFMSVAFDSLSGLRSVFLSFVLAYANVTLVI